ncbi:MAG: type 4a pilus biogenesis protein PilO [Gammaproteobacteria bacterium]|nr:type 4a pilus biogenesis protein PilO [Gammaproteobacteria bacterium]
MKNLMAKLSLRELHMLFLGAGAVLVVGLVAVLVIPEAKAVQLARKEVALLEQAAQDGSELDRHLQEQYSSIDELKYRLHGDMANLPVKQVEAFIIGRLQKISWNNKIELVSVEPATGERVQTFQEILFHVELVGQYEDLFRWLMEARSDLGYVVIKEYGMSRNDSDDENPLLLAELSLASYRAIQ